MQPHVEPWLSFAILNKTIYFTETTGSSLFTIKRLEADPISQTIIVN